MCKKYKNVSKVLNYTEHSLVLASPITVCVSVSAFASLIGAPRGINAITEGIKKYKSIIKKRKINHDKIVLLAKAKLNSIEALIFKVLTDSFLNSNKRGWKHMMS